MADYLNGLGIKTHNGSQFQCNTINRILRNRMYCGYFVAGDVESPHIERIQIIEEPLFFQAQYILDQRANTEKEKQQIARTTKGKTLLSGNLYCAHCGSRMVATSYVDRYTRRRRFGIPRPQAAVYLLQQGAETRRNGDGQAAYIAATVDDAVMEILRGYHGENPMSLQGTKP